MFLSRAALALTLALATPLINSVVAVDNLFSSQPYPSSDDGGKMRLLVSYNGEKARESIASQTLTLQGEGVQVQEVSNYNFKRVYELTSSADAGGDDAEGWVQEGAMSTGYSVLEFDSSDIKAEMEALKNIPGVVAVEKDGVVHASSTQNLRGGRGGAKDHMQGIQETIKATADKFPEEVGAIHDHDHGRRLAYSFAPFCESTQLYSYDSGHTKVAATEISIDNAPWIQLDLTGTELAAGSTLTIESETSSEEITSDILAANAFSSVFDGNSVTVTLTTPGDDSSRILIPNVNVGICKNDDEEVSNDSICGDVDDRVPSTDVRAGRIGGCTGWLISEDVFIQAGHCGTPSSSTRIHFTFGRSSAPTADQYAVDVSSYQGVNGGVGNDWGVGRLLPNSSTGKLPGVAQSEKCGTADCGWYELGDIPSTTTGNNIRVTGYGTAAVDSRSQKTHVGPLVTITSTSLRYRPDTTGGNSGSPVIHEETGKAIGVHTHGGCSSTGGSNLGTRIDRPDFAAKIASLLGPTPSPAPTSQPTPMPTNEGDGSQDDVPYGIDMVESKYVNDKPDPGNDPITICVVDTGYDLGHEDLPNSSHGVDGYSPYGGQVWDVDGHGHGTHCAGTIGAIGGNNVGVTSVNPDPTKFKFYIGKGLQDNGSGSWSGVMSSIDKCVENGAKVISMSLGGSGFSSTFNNSVKNHYDNGVLLIAAAGNGSNSALSYPASYTAVASVAAVDENRNRASFSQFNDQVELSGPGVRVKSTLPDNKYASWSGTSMATPHVAGVAALIWYNFPDCTNNQIRNVLIYSSEDRGEENWDAKYGWGLVNAKAAYDLLESQGCEAGGPSDYGRPLSQVGLGGKDQLSMIPTNAPTTSTASPTNAPSSSPTQSPTTAQPTSSPTTASPTGSPSSSPTQQPTTAQPSQSPTTAQPSSSPTNAPTQSPTTAQPTQSPTTAQPSSSPTNAPSASPTSFPTQSPTNQIKTFSNAAYKNANQKAKALMFQMQAEESTDVIVQEIAFKPKDVNKNTNVQVYLKLGSYEDFPDEGWDRGDWGVPVFNGIPERIAGGLKQVTLSTAFLVPKGQVASFYLAGEKEFMFEEGDEEFDESDDAGDFKMFTGSAFKKPFDKRIMAANFVGGMTYSTITAPITSSPTQSPTTASPTSSPSSAPTQHPTTSQPSQSPTTASPTTAQPTSSPTTSSPTSSPSSAPTQHPTTASPTSENTLKEFSTPNLNSAKDKVKGGIMYTITAPSKDVTIKSFGVFGKEAKESDISVYYSDEVYDNFNEFDKGNWIEAFDDKVMLYPDAIATIDLDDEFTISAGGTASVYIVSKKEMLFQKASDDEFDVYASNDDIELRVGVATKKEFEKRDKLAEFAGIIVYETS